MERWGGEDLFLFGDLLQKEIRSHDPREGCRTMCRCPQEKKNGEKKKERRERWGVCVHGGEEPRRKGCRSLLSWGIGEKKEKVGVCLHLFLLGKKYGKRREKGEEKTSYSSFVYSFVSVVVVVGKKKEPPPREVTCSCLT